MKGHNSAENNSFHDFDFLYNTLIETNIETLLSQMNNINDVTPVVQLVLSALEMSSHLLYDPANLAPQLCGRLGLFRHEHPKIDSLVKQALTYNEKPALLPLTASLEYPRGGDDYPPPDYSYIGMARRKHQDEVDKVIVSNGMAFSAGCDGTVRVWDTTTTDQFPCLGMPGAKAYGAIAVSGDIAASAHSNYAVFVCNYKTGEVLHYLLEGHHAPVLAIVISGDFVVSASADETIKVWNWTTGECFHTFNAHTGAVWNLAISGDYLLSASDDRTVRVWNWRVGQLLHTLKGHRSKVKTVLMTGDFAISAGDEATVYIWNWTTGELERKFGSYTNFSEISDVCSIATRGDFVLSASIDGTIRVWNWTTAQLERTLEGHSCAVHGLVISDDIAISGSFDNSLKIWNWHSGACLYTFHGDAKIRCVAADDNLHTIVAGDSAGNVHILRPNTALLNLMRSP